MFLQFPTSDLKSTHLQGEWREAEGWRRYGWIHAEASLANAEICPSDLKYVRGTNDLSFGLCLCLQNDSEDDVPTT